MGILTDKTSLRALAQRHGQEIIGAAQRVIAYTVVADYAPNTGKEINITAAAHGLKHNQVIYISTGGYVGIYRVNVVIGVNNFTVLAVFGSTSSGNITLTAALNGAGFFVDAVPLTIASFVPEDPNIDAAAFIARVFSAGQEVQMPFKSIRITAGNITAVRLPIPVALPYTNR